MIKKKAIIALAVAAALTVPFSVFAATSDTKTAKNIRGIFGIDASKLTDTQKADIKSYSQKMAELQKEFINKMVGNGSMTKEQGDAAIKKIDEAVKNGGETGYIPGFGMGKGGFEGRGRQDGFGIGKFDTSKLTAEQKADLKAISAKAVTLQKDLISKAVTAGVITKEQGDTATKKIDAMTSKIQDEDATCGFMLGRGGFGGFGLQGIKDIDTSKLTDEQKAIFTDFSKSMADLQKEIINKLVADGIMTKEQGDTAIQRIDAMGKNTQNFKFSQDGKGMKKGHFNGKARQGGAGAGTTTGTSITTQSAM